MCICTSPRHRRFGAIRGKAKIGPAFFEPLPEEELPKLDRRPPTARKRRDSAVSRTLTNWQIVRVDGKRHLVGEIVGSGGWCVTSPITELSGDIAMTGRGRYELQDRWTGDPLPRAVDVVLTAIRVWRLLPDVKVHWS